MKRTKHPCDILDTKNAINMKKQTFYFKSRFVWMQNNISDKVEEQVW